MLFENPFSIVLQFLGQIAKVHEQQFGHAWSIQFGMVCDRLQSHRQLIKKCNDFTKKYET
jgi:hypothetical protein